MPPGARRVRNPIPRGRPRRRAGVRARAPATSARLGGSPGARHRGRDPGRDGAKPPPRSILARLSLAERAGPGPSADPARRRHGGGVGRRAGRRTGSGDLLGPVGPRHAGPDEVVPRTGRRHAPAPRAGAGETAARVERRRTPPPFAVTPERAPRARRSVSGSRIAGVTMCPPRDGPRRRLHGGARRRTVFEAAAGLVRTPRPRPSGARTSPAADAQGARDREGARIAPDPLARRPGVGGPRPRALRQQVALERRRDADDVGPPPGRRAGRGPGPHGLSRDPGPGVGPAG